MKYTLKPLKALPPGTEVHFTNRRWRWNKEAIPRPVVVERTFNDTVWCSGIPFYKEIFVKCHEL